MQLRDYQQTAIGKLRSTLRAGKRRPVMVVPTGGGKSIIFGQVIANCVANGKTVLWLVHRRNLVQQMATVLNDHFDIRPGIIMAGIESDVYQPVQLSTIQSYARRIQLDDLERNKFYIRAALVLVDESHRSVSKSYQDVLNLYADKIIIGCTATPMRADQRGLGEVYDSIVDVTNVQELTEAGHLSPVRYFAPVAIDLAGVKTAGGDYVVKDLGARVNSKKLNGDVVENWLKHAESRKTIVFAVNVKHSIALCEAFNRAGVAAEHLDARSSDDERDEVFDRMSRGDTTVICNVALYQEGLDVPDVSCIVMARPTKSLGLWRQCGGRGLRIFDGKDNLLVLDHGNVLEENGLLADPIEWSLDGKKKAWAKKKKPKERQPVKCQTCNLVFEGSSVCPDCGSPVKTFGKLVETVDADLQELGAKKRASMAEKRIWYGMLKHYQRAKGFKAGWVSHKYKERMGVWPRKMDSVAPIEPNQEFQNWMTHQRIKWAKSKRREIHGS